MLEMMRHLNVKLNPVQIVDLYQSEVAKRKFHMRTKIPQMRTMRKTNQKKIQLSQLKIVPVIRAAIIVMIQFQLIGTLLGILITILILRMKMNHGILMALLMILNRTNCNFTIMI